MREEPFGDGTVWIGEPGHPIQHRRYGFDHLPPRRTTLSEHTRSYLGEMPAATYRRVEHPVEAARVAEGAVVSRSYGWHPDYAPRGAETWVQVYPLRDWECVLAGGVDYSGTATTDTITAGDERLRRRWRLQ